MIHSSWSLLSITTGQSIEAGAMAFSSSSVPDLRNNLSCARCHINEVRLERRLLNCGGCRSVQCCSQECQRNDCSRHKQMCRSVNRGGPPTRTPTRTTMRMRGSELFGLDVSMREPFDLCAHSCLQKDRVMSTSKTTAPSTISTPLRRIFTTSASPVRTILTMRSLGK